MFNGSSKILAFLTGLVLVVIIFQAGNVHGEMNWTHETLDHRDYTSFFSAIAVDANDEPRIAYGTVSGGANYTWRSGGTWTSEHISDQTVQAMDMVQDSAGEPHVAWVYGSYYTEGISYASRAGGSWSTETLVNSTKVIGYVSVAVDNANRPHVMYETYDSKDIYVASRDASGTWSHDLVSNDGGWGRFSMVGDGTGNLHITFENYSSGEIMYGIRPASGGSWQFRDLGPGSLSSGGIDIALDPAGNPAVICGLDYYHYTGSAWEHTVLVSPQMYTIDYQSLAFDMQGHPHLAHFQSYILYHAADMGSGWEFEQVLNDNAGWFCSLAMDSAGNAHISHYNGNWDNLTYTLGTPVAGTPGDSDNDGLPDSWETSNFGNLAQGPGDDPDGDGHDNMNEYNAGTDPNDPQDPGTGSSTDSDNDGLPDSWETSNFGNLAQGPGDDPDGDGFDNLAEYNAGTDPNDPDSFPLAGLSVLGSLLCWLVLIVIVIVVIALVVKLARRDTGNYGDAGYGYQQPAAGFEQQYAPPPPDDYPPPPPPGY